MNIEVIPKHGRKEILSILINGEEWRSIHTAIFGKEPSFPVCTSESEWQKAFEKMEYKRVKGYVLRRLSAQNYHSGQLIKLLQERLVTSSVIESIIDEFQNKGYLNDRGWIESFIRVQRKRLGLPVILRKLQAKGVSREEIRMVQEECRNSEEDSLNITHLLKTRYRSKDMNHPKDRQKVIASLMRKGFAFEIIQRAISSNSTE